MFHTFLDIMKIGDRDKDKVVDALYDSWLLPLRSTLFSLFHCQRESYGYLAPNGWSLTPLATYLLT
jgi:hypothetical protein